ncbi:MAG TPA: glycosyl transferase family 1 [Candidatus Moranbacteria bacterium]|nr:glycosyl transferase family 1 [Candidatus Moranbacteria bacterium]HAT75030.1 glycosyl transferase family 1 [Candidatus Moranbacteria bacterium]
MKIAYIGQKGIPAKIGGVERYAEEVAVRMAKLGHDVFVYARNNYTDKNLKKYKGVNIINLPGISTKNLDAISHTFLATIHALFQDYDVIHYSSIGPTSLCVISKIFNKKAVIISTFQCQDYFHQKWGVLARAYLRFSEKITCSIPDKTIAVSKILCEYSLKKYKKELICIPNGTNFKFNYSDDFLSQWNLKKEEYILSAGRLVKHKGLHYLIEAFNNLCEKKLNNNKKLVIAGDGAYTDDYVKYLKELVKNNTEIIFTGAVDGEKLEELFSHCFLFVQPSESEGMSLALLEAMGYGKVALVSDIPENREIIKKADFIFKNKDTKDLENKILRFIENPCLVAKAGEENLQTAKQYYDWDNIVSQIDKLYKDTFHAKNQP